MKNISIKALAIGTAVDLAASFAGGLLVGVALVVIHAAKGGDPGKYQASTMSFEVLLISLFIGLLATVLGAYVTAAVAPLEKIKNSCIFGVLGTLLCLLFSWSFPLWYIVACVLLVIPSSYLGGLLRTIKRET